MMTMKINGCPIAPSHPPYIIAEMSANHNGDLDTAFNIMAAAKEAGASAIKMQTYRPDTITLDSDRPEFRIEDGLWKGRRLYDLYEEAHTPWEWHGDLFDYARELGITLFSSPFDPSAVDLLESLGAPAYKVASFEVIDLPLIRYIASTGKPMIMSTGMADAEEIAESVAAAREAGCTQLALLHCVSGYPAPASDYNLRTIPDMAERFAVPTGLSDHTLDNATAVTSIALGGCIIEKHFTLDRNGGGPDDSFSLEPDNLAALCRDTQTAWEALGQIDYGRKSSEEGNVKFRRSLYFVEDVRKGDIIEPSAVRSVRPGYGIPPKHIDIIVGSRAAQDIKKHTPVKWTSFQQS